MTKTLLTLFFLLFSMCASAQFVAKATPGKSVGLGQALDISLSFSTNIKVTGNPRLDITVGTSQVKADYLSGSGSRVLFFRYTVQPGDSDSDGIFLASAIDLNGGTLKYGVTNAIPIITTILHLPSMSVDTSAPTISSVTAPVNGTYNLNQTVAFAVTFSEIMTVSGTPRIPVDVGGTTRYANYVSGTGTNKLTFTYTVVDPDADGNGISLDNSIDINGGVLTDRAENSLSSLSFTPPNTSGIIVAGNLALITAVTPPAGGTYNVDDNMDFVVTFSKAVTVTGNPQLTINLVESGERKANYLSGSGTNSLTFRYVVGSGFPSPSGLRVVTPLQLNGGTIKDLSDTTPSLVFVVKYYANLVIVAPLPTLTNVIIPTDVPALGYHATETVDIRIVFSEPMIVAGPPPRLAIQVGSFLDKANYYSGSGTNTLTFRYNVAPGQEDLDGITIPSPVLLKGGTIKTLNGVNAPLSFGALNTSSLIVDAVLPRIVSNTLPASGPYQTGDTIEFLVNYARNVFITGTPNLKLFIGTNPAEFGTGQERYAAYHSGSGTTQLKFRYTFTAADSDTDGIILSYYMEMNGGTMYDANGNNGNDWFFTGIKLVTWGDTPIVIDNDYPTITTVTPPSNGIYHNTQSLGFDLEMSAAVTVTGTPRIAIDLGGVTRYATYLSGTGTSTLSFGYTVVSADYDTNGISITSPLELNGGTIKRDNVSANLTFAAPDLSGVLIYGSDPILSVTPPSAATYVTGQNLDFIVNYREAVNVTGTPQMNITLDSGSAVAQYVSGSGTTALTFRYTIASDDADANGITVSSPLDLNSGTIQNLAGTLNANLFFTLPVTSGVIVDGIDAVISSVTAPANRTYYDTEDLNFTVNYSAAVTVIGIPTIAMTVGASSVSASYVSGSGSTALIFRYTVATGNLAASGISISSPIVLNGGSIKDSFGDNAALSFSPPTTSGILVDGVHPTISSITGPSAATYYSGAHLNFTMNFSENVVVTGTPRIAMVLGAATVYANYLSGSGTTALVYRYTIGATDFDNNGIAVSSPLDLNSGTLKDQAGNGIVTLTFTPPTTSSVNVDGVAASINSVTASANATYKTGNTINLTANFNRTMTVVGTPRIAIVVGSTTRYANYTSGSGSAALIFSFVVPAADSDSNGIAVSSSIDLNGGTIKTGTNDATLTFTPPTTTGVLVDGIDIGISSITAPANGSYKTSAVLDFVVNYNFAAVVTGSPRIQLTVGATTLYATYVSGSGTTAHTFRYTVLASHLDTNGIATVGPSIGLNGGTIRDSFGDNATLTFSALTYTNVLVDGVSPTISGVVAPSAGTYFTPQTLNFTVNFSEAVTVSGSPRIAMVIGATAQYATYLSGSGSTALIFRYTVQSGDSDANGIATSSPLQLNSGTIVDSSGNTSSLTFTPPNTTAVRVSSAGATISSVTPPANATYKTGTNLNFIANFSRAVDVTGTPRIALTVGSTTLYANYLSGTGTTALTFRYTVGTGDSDNNGIAVTSPMSLNGGTIKDSTATDATLTFTSPATTSVLVDGLDISIASVTAPADSTYRVGQNMDFIVNYTYPAVVVGSPRIQLTVGATTLYATYSSGSGTTAHTFRYTVLSGHNDSDGIATVTLALNGGTIRDIYGDNANITFSASNYANKKVDGLLPTISSMVVSANKTYKANEVISFTATYSEAVNIVGSPRITLTVGTTTRYATYASGTGTNLIVFSYTVPAGDLDANGIAATSPISTNGGSISDLNGNSQITLTYTVPSLVNVRVDAIVPTISSITAPANTTYGPGTSILIRAVFSEIVNVTGSPVLNLNIGGATRAATYSAGTGTTTISFTYTVVSGDVDTNGIDSLAPISLNGGTIRDAGLNNATLTFTAANYVNVRVDGIAPAVSSVTLPANASYKPAGILNFTVVYNEAVNVVTTGGTPYIDVTFGSTVRRATYVSGSTSTSLVFRYTLVAGDVDYDGISLASSITLNGGTLRDARLNSASTSIGSTNTTRIFAIPNLMSYWYDLTSTTTVGASASTLTQFSSKGPTVLNGTITGAPTYSNTGFNTGTSGYVSLVGGSKYIALGNLTVKYVIAVFKTPSATGRSLLLDTSGAGTAASRAQMTFNTSGATGMNLGTSCGSLCKIYNGSAWSTANASGNVAFAWTAGDYQIVVLDYAGLTNLGFTIGSNSFNGELAELMIYTGSTAVANSEINTITTYLMDKHNVNISLGFIYKN